MFNHIINCSDVPVCVRDRTIISARRGESIQLDCDMRSTEESAMFAWSSGDQVPLPDQVDFYYLILVTLD